MYFFLYKSIENRDRYTETQLAGKQLNFGHCNTTTSYYKNYFLKKELNSTSGKKPKKIKKKKKKPTWKVKLSC